VSRGGKRKGTVGTQYPNRSDLRAPALANQPSTYGDKAQQQRAVQAVPLPRPQGSVPGPALAGGPAPAPPIPGASPFDRPTERPGEPVTAGLPIGAGPGPSMAQPAVDAVVETLRAAVARFPTPGALALLEALDPSYRQ
jgi:hypothetical protein